MHTNFDRILGRRTSTSDLVLYEHAAKNPGVRGIHNMAGGWLGPGVLLAFTLHERLSHGVHSFNGNLISNLDAPMLSPGQPCLLPVSLPGTGTTFVHVK